jgi:hypothetical protein
VELEELLHFFLEQEVTLKQERYLRLENYVKEIQGVFRNDPAFAQNENKLIGQGSCFFGTAIEPIGGRELDMDVLLEIPHRDTWDPRRYLIEVERSLREARHFRGWAQQKSRCVRIDFDEVVHVDVIPLIILPSHKQVIPYFDDNSFQPVNPGGLAQWIDQQDRKINKNFRRVVRLLKYAHAINGNLPCPPIILTILLGRQVDRIGRVAETFDLITSLVRLIGSLCSSIDRHSNTPPVCDPSCIEVTFQHRWPQKDYLEFKRTIKVYNAKVSRFLDDEKSAWNPKLWQPIFGAKFVDYMLPKL